MALNVEAAVNVQNRGSGGGEKGVVNWFDGNDVSAHFACASLPNFGKWGEGLGEEWRVWWEVGINWDWGSGVTGYNIGREMIIRSCMVVKDK